MENKIDINRYKMIVEDIKPKVLKSQYKTMQEVHRVKKIICD